MSFPYDIPSLCEIVSHILLINKSHSCIKQKHPMYYAAKSNVCTFQASNNLWRSGQLFNTRELYVHRTHTGYTKHGVQTLNLMKKLMILILPFFTHSHSHAHIHEDYGVLDGVVFMYIKHHIDLRQAFVLYSKRRRHRSMFAVDATTRCCWRSFFLLLIICNFL